MGNPSGHHVVDDNGLQVLEHEECLRLLRGSYVGRVGVSWRALPTVLPVNYALDGDDQIVIRTGAGSLLGSALTERVIAFEVDDMEPVSHTGWSVVVVGRARMLTDPDAIARARLLPLRPWASGDKDLFVTIETRIVTGRRVL